MLVFGLAYLIGAFPTAYILARRLRGMDIRDYGSGNAGTTNVLRILGWRWALLTFVVDLGKGVLVVCLADWMLPSDEWNLGRIVAAMIAVLGHIYPVYIGWRGGKGAAVIAGVLLALRPWDMCISMGVFITVLLTTRYVSLSTLMASFSFSSLIWIRFIWESSPQLYPYLFLSVFVSFVIVFMHRDNIRRLWKGSEPMIHFRASS